MKKHYCSNKVRGEQGMRKRQKAVTWNSTSAPSLIYGAFPRPSAVLHGLRPRRRQTLEQALGRKPTGGAMHTSLDGQVG